MQRTYQSPLVRVSVYALDGALIGRANAALEPLTQPGSRIALEFDESLGGHVAQDVPPDSYSLSVSADGLEPQRRPVVVDETGLEETVVLGRPGLPHYFRGAVKVPYEPLPYIAVSFAGSPTALDPTVGEIVRRFQVEAVPVGESVRSEHVRVFRLPGDADGERRVEIIGEISRLRGVRHAGLVTSFREDSVSFMTNEFVAKFQPSVDRGDVLTLTSNLGLTVQRPIPYAGNAFLLHARDPLTGVAACDALLATGRVVYAEPNMVVTAQNDQVNPPDFLVAQQWYLPLVNLPGAWESLRLLNAPGVGLNGPGDLTYGSESITIAIFDQGIISKRTGRDVQALHPDFAGTVTSGATKIAQYFDFLTMSPDNDNPPNKHGIHCAGIAAALADNPSTVLGEQEGIAGAAPNCRVMGLIRPAGADELQYSDAYIWMAGFDPSSVQKDFPAPLPAGTGADVISNSFGASSGVPISGFMKDCFDYLTTNGRGGKGTVLCFSAGDAPVDFRLQRPWAAYEKTIAIAASTRVDTRAPYSGFGPGIDLCAPGGDTPNLLLTCDQPGKGNLAGHTGGDLDYSDNQFIGVSASVPLVAGVAALVLSAASNLTWSEVLDALCSTAVHIDLANTHATGHWVDSDGDGNLDYSQWYGCGRVNAKAAVDAAAALSSTGVTSSAPSAPTNLHVVRGRHRHGHRHIVA